MRDDQIAAVLREANPWWLAAAMGRSPTEWTASHRLLRDRGRYDLGYRSNVLDDVAKGPVDDKLVVLTGPRRVGKSIALIDAAAALCARDDVDPRQVIHVPADDFSAADLGRAFVLGRDLTSSVDRPEPRRRVWLLDEVSGIPGWTATLKRLRDQTLAGDDTVIATGSRWVGVEDVTANLFAGRAGSGAHRRIRHMFPMSFRDFLMASGRNLPAPPPAPLWDLQSATVRDQVEALTFLVDDYDLAWQAYLRSGGFPRAVFEAVTDGAVSQGYLRDLEAWLVADVGPDDTPDSVALLLDALAARTTSPLNLTKTARDLGYGTRQQFDRRVKRLIATFAAIECPQRDERGAVIGGAQAKYYLSDPILAWLPSRLRAGLAEPDLTALTEATIGTTLALALENQQEGRLAFGDTIGYLRTDSGKEVDLCPVAVATAGGTGTTTPIESKWVARGWRAEAKVIEGKYQGGVLATRNILDLSERAWAVPAPLIALLLR
ncbi:AAA family ATPase [Raineyella sp. W15-4]|uniref:AAA family ATPase n=1 Tax=Raineyella sp. W15-4 TaxID=3081651 RepID=UPI0029559D93|nr:AAA family ATPase [Raineyella sp. W15-4]WOQ17118.1 AAA family ATPase [Raineyella sp. W15-4]